MSETVYRRGFHAQQSKKYLIKDLDQASNNSSEVVFFYEIVVSLPRLFSPKKRFTYCTPLQGGQLPNILLIQFETKHVSLFC